MAQSNKQQNQGIHTAATEKKRSGRTGVTERMCLFSRQCDFCYACSRDPYYYCNNTSCCRVTSETPKGMSRFVNTEKVAVRQLRKCCLRFVESTKKLRFVKSEKMVRLKEGKKNAKSTNVVRFRHAEKLRFVAIAPHYRRHTAM